MSCLLDPIGTLYRINENSALLERTMSAKERTISDAVAFLGLFFQQRKSHIIRCSYGSLETRSADLVHSLKLKPCAIARSAPSIKIQL
ncbi:hypothetical protein L596_010520 [Steinernema carpocapsae]|uniref:Uncharacterized protein n=1 Tax=Steinernema carpocapsae TaxID=34508 RepID=A0A4V6A6Y8_STECR|nr:hypothetical protein L596_010520 [Steinernema carpocapsae]